MTWLTTAKAADYTGRHPETVRAAAAMPHNHQGALHGYQRTAPKGKWTFHTECLDAWIQGEPCTHRTNVTVLRRRGAA